MFHWRMLLINRPHGYLFGSPKSASAFYSGRLVGIFTACSRRGHSTLHACSLVGFSSIKNGHLALLKTSRALNEISDFRCFNSVSQAQVKSPLLGDPQPQPFIKSALQLMRCHALMPVVIIGMPVMWSATMAMPPVVGLEEVKKLALLAIGCFFTRVSGCCINDLADAKFDAQVERTKFRPLACGNLTRPQAFCVLGVNASIALSILLQFDYATIAMGFAAAALASLYPFSKRFTNYPQLILGCSFAVGTLMAWTAMTGGSLAIAPFCLYTASAMWTLIYDTVYAHQDKVYDKRLGLKSLALHWGDDCKKRFNVIAYNMSMILTSCGYFAQLGDVYYAGVLASHLWMLREIKKVDLNDPESCMTFFKNSWVYGALLLGGIAAGKGFTLHAPSDESSKDTVAPAQM